MKPTLLFLMLILSSSRAFCQFDVKLHARRLDGNLLMDSLYIHGQAVNTERTEYRGKLLNIRFKHPEGQNIHAEFYMIDSTSYFYAESSPKQKIITAGKLDLVTESIKTDSIPFFDSVGNITGYRLLQNIIFRFIKNDESVENTSEEITARGFYINNKKDGEWAYYKVANCISTDFKVEHYRDGELESVGYSDMLDKSEDTISSLIDGQWEPDMHIGIYEMDSAFSYHKVSAKGYARHFLRFDKADKVLFSFAGHHTANEVFLTRIPGKGNDGHIAFLNKEKKVKLTVYFLSAVQLVVKASIINND